MSPAGQKGRAGGIVRAKESSMGKISTGNLERFLERRLLSLSSEYLWMEAEQTMQEIWSRGIKILLSSLMIVKA
jgi:hypothetical protein